MNANIVGTGVYVPEKIVTNDDLSRILGEDINEFVTTVLGIHERHVCAANESTADLATNAGRQALENAGIDPAELDLIILATDTPEQLSPATSVVVTATVCVPGSMARLPEPAEETTWPSTVTTVLATPEVGSALPQLKDVPG